MSVQQSSSDTYAPGEEAVKRSRRLCLIIVAAGIVAAMHVAKLAPALPRLQQSLHISLAQAGLLLSSVQIAGMTLGLVVGLMAERIGLRRCISTGLAILALASGLGCLIASPGQMLLLRALEGVGLLMTCTPAPSLIRRLAPRGKLDALLGLWGAYVPLGASLALLTGPRIMRSLDWSGWWLLLGGLASLMAFAVVYLVPPDDPRPDANERQFNGRLFRTLTHRSTWLISFTFMFYSGQWLAVVGLLPLISADSGFTEGHLAISTAAAALVNAVGNVVSGRALQRGVRAWRVIQVGFLGMALGACVAFVPWGGAGPAFKYAGVLTFSLLGGLIPGALFPLSVRLPQQPADASTTVGCMQQCSALGQFAGPPLVAWLAGAVGGWQWTWAVCVACCGVGLVLAQAISRVLLRASCHQAQKIENS